MSGGGGDAPQRDAYGETVGEIRAKVGAAPAMYRAEAEFGPKYTALELNQLHQLLYGIEPSTKQIEWEEQESGWRNTQTGEFRTGKRPDPPVIRNPHPGTKYDPWQEYTRTTKRTKEVTTEAAPGLLSLLKSSAGTMADIEADALSQQRTRDIQDVEALGARSLEATRAADPAQTRIMDELTRQAEQDLALGGKLTPDQMRFATQGVSAAAGARGWGFNPGDLADAKMAASGMADELQGRRRQFASGVSLLRSGTYGDALNRVLGRPAAANAQGILGMAGAAGASSAPSLFGSSINYNDLYSQNANAQSAKQIAAANNQAALMGAGVSGAAAIVSAALIAL